MATYSNEAYGESMAQSRRAPVNEAMEALDREIEQLGKNSEMLEMRLVPVLIPADRVPPGVPSVMTSDRPLPMNEPQVPLSDEIRMRRERIRGLALHLAELHGRLGI